jgi:galactose mutarotase-like enzyme
VELLTLEDARTRVRLAPELGAGIARLEALIPGGPIDILRPWSVAHAGPRVASLTLAEGQIGPWRYAAALTVGLRNGALALALHIRNRSGRRLPFGGGFHPWFPRYPTTRLALAAKWLWLEDERHLPLRHLPIADVPDLDFRRSRPLPVAWVNNAFTGWDRNAEIQQSGLSLQLTASKALTTAVIYSPGACATFFCVEPVSHPVDAHNLPGTPGLTELDDGAETHLAMALLWRTGRNAKHRLRPMRGRTRGRCSPEGRLGHGEPNRLDRSPPVCGRVRTSSRTAALSAMQTAEHRAWMTASGRA